MIVAEWKGEAVSANRRLVPGKGRWIANNRYLNFKNSLAWAVKAAAMRNPIEMAVLRRAAVHVRLELVLPANMDTDAVVKPCLDALQVAGVVENDNQVKEIEAIRVGNAPTSMIRFFIREVT